jgi:hypothetical protein
LLVVLARLADATPASSSRRSLEADDHLAAGAVRDFDMLIEEGFPGGSIVRTGALLLQVTHAT